jgi:hypothetical protein
VCLHNLYDFLGVAGVAGVIHSKLSNTGAGFKRFYSKNRGVAQV